MTKFTNENTTFAAYRVFETLKFLIQKPANVTEIIKHLESLDKNNEKIYSKAVIYKYLSTLKFCGINLKRNKCKFEIEKLPFKLNFEKDELTALFIIKKFLEATPEKNISENIKQFFYRLKMYNSSEENIINDELNFKKSITEIKPTDTEIKTIKYYEKFFDKKIRLNITYTNILDNIKTQLCEPIEVLFDNGNIYLQLYSIRPNEFVEININQIINIEETPQTCTNRFSASTTIFELREKLAKRYTLRNNERVVMSNNNILTIANQTESKEKLYLRLMRYGKLCQVVSPKTDIEIMKQIIKKAIDNNNRG